MQTGFDAPVTDASDDAFGRRHLAKEIATLLAESPQDWSVRIGVYGPWGSGKSSVLNLVSAVARQHGVIVVRFNPWGYREPASMLDALASAIRSELDRELGSAGSTALAARQLSSKLFDWLGTAAEAHEVGKAVHGAVVKPLADLIRTKPGDIEHLARTSGLRISILIDDVDRASTNVLPGLLFLVKELLDLGGLSFVLALDPSVVGEVLGTEHAGFKDGKRFLEKVVDFPFDLPEPSPPEIHAVVARDVARHSSFVPLDAVASISDLLPGNPRRARSFARQLWTLRDEVKRYDASELDWRLLLQLSLIRTLYPAIFDRLARTSELADRLVELSVVRVMLRSTDEDEKKRAEELASYIEEVIASADVPSADITHARRLLNSLCSRRSGWNAEKLAEHARVLGSPPALTWREAAQLLSAPKASDWIAEHAQRQQIDFPRMVAAACNSAADSHASCLQEAAESLFESDLFAAADKAEKWLVLLEALLFECDGAVGACHLPSSEAPALLRKLFRHSHFRNHPRYVELRSRERRLAVRIAREAGWQQLDVLPAMTASNPRNGGTERRAWSAYRALTSIVSRRAAMEVVALFDTKNSIQAIAFAPESAVTGLLFNPKSSLWRGTASLQLIEFLTSSPATEVRATNAFMFLVALADVLNKNQRAATYATDTGRALLQAMWSAATFKTVNVRLFSELQKTRSILEQILPTPLTEPPWWQGCAALHSMSTD